MKKCMEKFGTYETVKVVQLKDGRLACFRFLTLLGVLAYVLIMLFKSHQYAKFVRPIGQVAVDFVPPARNFSTHHAYCSSDQNDQKSMASDGLTYAPDAQFPCVVWDNLQFVTGIVPSSTFITTHVNASYQELADCTDDCASPWTTTKIKNTYMSQVEEYSIKLSTTFQAQKNAVSSSDSIANMTYYLKGKLVDPLGNTIKEFGNMQSDAFPIKTLLQAAGVESIDDLSDWTYNTKDLNYTYRTLGMLLVVNIEMNNRDGALLGDPSYVYSVTRVPNKKYHVSEISPEPVLDAKNRVVYDRYGIQIVFTVIGDIGYFDFQTLLLTLIGGSAMLSVSTFLVEFFMLKVLRNKAKYKDLKYDVVSIGDSAAQYTAIPNY